MQRKPNRPHQLCPIEPAREHCSFHGLQQQQHQELPSLPKPITAAYTISFAPVLLNAEDYTAGSKEENVYSSARLIISNALGGEGCG